MSNLLEVRNLSKSYASGTERLRRPERALSLELEAGVMAAVTGVSGSGKSTLLHVLGGMDKPDSGSIVIDGQEITTLDAGQPVPLPQRHDRFRLSVSSPASGIHGSWRT